MAHNRSEIRHEECTDIKARGRCPFKPFQVITFFFEKYNT